MPLCEEQRRAMDAELRASTLYNWDARSPEVTCSRTYIIDCFERVLDARRSLARDLVLPHSFIRVEDPEGFWCRMVACLAKGTNDTVPLPHHTSIYGDNTYEARCILTWPSWTDERMRLCIYTKWLHDGHRRALRWMVRKSIDAAVVDDDDENDSAADTEAESIVFF